MKRARKGAFLLGCIGETIRKRQKDSLGHFLKSLADAPCLAEVSLPYRLLYVWFDHLNDEYQISFYIYIYIFKV